jgi:hypothetical protein
MAILKSVWGHVQRPWGYEVRVDFEDGGAIHNEVLTFPKEPGAKELDAAVAGLRVSVESRIALEAAEAAKPPEPTQEELTAKVVELEARVATVEIEKAILISEKEALLAEKIILAGKVEL